MSWSVPHSWQTGEMVTNWKLTTDITDNMNAARQLWHMAVRLNFTDAEPQAIEANEKTVVLWSEATWQVGDSSGLWSDGERSRLLAPVGGWYQHTLAVEFDNASGGLREIGYRFNGAGAFWRLGSMEDGNGGRATKLSGTDIVQCTTVDFIEDLAYQGSTDDLNLKDGTDATYCIWRFVAEAT